MGRLRNHIAKMPGEVRFHIYELLYDSYEYDEIRNDPEVITACAAKKCVLHNTTFLATIKSQEYQEYCAKVQAHSKSLRADKITASLLKDNATIADTNEVTRFEISRQLQEMMSELSEESELSDRVKLIRSLTASLATLDTTALNQKLEAKDAQIATLEAKIATLEAKIITLTQVEQRTISSATLKEIEEQTGLL